MVIRPLAAVGKRYGLSSVVVVPMQRRIRKPEVKSAPLRTKVSVVRAVGNPLAEEERKLTLQTEVVQLKTQGLSHRAIAQELGISTISVAKYLSDGLEEYHATRDNAVKDYLALCLARYDRIYRTWLPLSEPRYVMVKDDEGLETEVFYPPDPEATRIILTAQRDAAKMMGLNKVRVEHTGKDGANIAVDLDWNSLSDEQLEKFGESGDFSVIRAFAGAIAGARPARAAEATGSED